MTEYEKKVWFYFTHGMIQGLCEKTKAEQEDRDKLMEQFNKIGPTLKIEDVT